MSLPIEIVHGARPGPVMWLSAAIHGDELNGVPIIRQVLRRLDPVALSGTIVAVPVVNVFGLINELRYLPDHRDLNRSFPGSKRGSLAARLAYLFMSEVVSRCEFGIDYHTGSGGRTNLPQLRCNLDDPETAAAAKHFGAPLVLHSRLRDGSLRAAAGDLAIRCLLYEAGEASRLSEEAIRVGVEGTMRVLSHLRMTRGVSFERRTPMISRHSRWLRASRSGFLEMRVQLGAKVREGQLLAQISGVESDDQVEVRAAQSGIVIGHQTTALVYRGDGIIHIASL